MTSWWWGRAGAKKKGDVDIPSFRTLHTAWGHAVWLRWSLRGLQPIERAKSPSDRNGSRPLWIRLLHTALCPCNCLTLFPLRSSTGSINQLLLHIRSSCWRQMVATASTHIALRVHSLPLVEQDPVDVAQVHLFSTGFLGSRQIYEHCTQGASSFEQSGLREEKTPQGSHLNASKHLFV